MSVFKIVPQSVTPPATLFRKQGRADVPARKVGIPREAAKKTKQPVVHLKIRLAAKYAKAARNKPTWRTWRLKFFTSVKFQCAGAMSARTDCTTWLDGNFGVKWALWGDCKVF